MQPCSWTKFIPESCWKRVLWVLENPGIWSLQVLESPGKQYFTVCTNPVSLFILSTGFVQTLESPGIKILRFPGLESPGKRHKSWKTLEKSWNSKVVVLEILISGTSIINLRRHSFYTVCNLLPFGSVWISIIAFGLVYCNAVTLITDLICALFGPYAAMFANRIYPGKSLKTSFLSPGKPWNLVFASPGKSWKTVFYVCTNPVSNMMKSHSHYHTRLATLA